MDLLNPLMRVCIPSHPLPFPPPPPDELHLPVLWQKLEQAKDKEQLNRVAAQIKNQLEQLDNKQVHLPAHPWVTRMLVAAWCLHCTPTPTTAVHSKAV